MKILYISDVFFPRVNGVSTSIATFRSELQKLGHRVDLAAPRYGGEPEEDGIIRFDGRSVPFDPEDRWIHRKSVLEHHRHLIAQQYDLVHVQTPFVAHRVGLRLAKELGVPVVETYHTFFEEYLYHYLPFAPRGWMRGLARYFSRHQCNRVDALVVPSRAMEDALTSYGVHTQMYRIPTGLKPEEFACGNGARFRDKYRIPTDRPTLVHIGRVAFEKNISFLLRMLRRLVSKIPNVLLVIAGEGPAVPSLKQQVQELDLDGHVLFLGYMDRGTELMDCYRAADGFVFASRTETQGLVLLEAMALSVPVVSTAVMGTRDILEPEKGCLVAQEDEQDFAAKVESLLTNSQLRNRLRREAREYALVEWNAATMAQRLAEVYQGLTREHRLKTAA